MASEWDEFALAEPQKPDESWDEFAPANEPSTPQRLATVAEVTQGLQPDKPLGLVPSHEPFDWERFAEEAPKTASFIQDPRRMVAAKDDLEQLNWLEWSVSGAPTVDGYQAPVWWEALKKGWGGVRSSLEKTRQQLGVDPAWTQVLYPGSVSDTNEAQRRERVDLDITQASRELHAQSLLAKGFAGTFQAIPFIAGNAVAGAAAGPAGVFGFNSATFYGPVRERLGEVQGPDGEALSEGKKTVMAAAVAIPAGAAMTFGLSPLAGAFSRGAAEKIAANAMAKALASKSLTRLVADATVRWGAHNAMGAATMAATAAAEDLVVQQAERGVGARDEIDLEQAGSAFAESFKTAFTDFALIAAFGSGRQLVREIGVSRASALETSRLQAILDQAQGSKLVERAPGEAEQLIAQTAGGQAVFAEVGAWDTYWQSKKVDPRAIAAEVVGDGGKAYENAKATGQDLALPLEKYVARLGKTEAVAALAPDVKTNPELRTPRQEAEHQKQVAKLVEEARKARGSAFDEEKRQVLETIRTQAEAAGISKVEAESVAQLVSEFSGTMALRMNVSVAEAASVAGVQRIRVLGAKGEPVIRAAQDALISQLPESGRATVLAARGGDRRAQARLETAAYVEPLTQLLNRAAFEDYKVERRAGSWEVAIDANDLGAQDIFGGHETGNRLLKTVADAMRAAGEKTGGKGRLFRWGGDEFHAGGFASEAEARAFGEALKAAVAEAGEVAPGYRASLSIGVGPDVGAADRASYEAKAEKKAKVGGYSKEKREAGPWATSGESFVSVTKDASPADVKLNQPPSPPASRRLSVEEVREISMDLRAKHPDVDFSLTGGSGGALVLSKIVAKERGKGAGSAFMRDLVRAADERGVLLAATPSTDFGGTKSRIVAFNKRFGFVENKGRTKDYEISETMYRRPGGRDTLNQGDRGAIQMRLDPTGKPVEFKIEILQGDRSTFAHETAHWLSWALHDLATSDKATPEIRADYEALLKWAGYENAEARLAASRRRAELASAGLEQPPKGATATVDELRGLKAKEEKFSHAWEQYLAEGKPPSTALARTFARFKNWMLKIYRGVAGIEAQYREQYGQELALSDDVRGIFDRMLSAETETRKAENDGDGAAVEKLLSVLPPEAQAELIRARDDRRQAQTDEMFRLLTEADRESRELIVETERDRIRGEVEAEVSADPVYRALDYLKGEKAENLPPTLLDPAGKPWKLDRGDVVAMFGEDFAKTMPRGTMAKKGGAPAAHIAEQLKYPGGADEFVRALQGAKSKASVVEAKTDARLREALAPELLQRVQEAQTDSAHTPKAFEEAIVGARILARTVDPSLEYRYRAIDREKLKETAEAIVADTAVRQVSPSRALEAERRHARAAAELTAKAVTAKDETKRRDLAAQAMDAREGQLLNAAIWRAAKDRAAQNEKTGSYLRKFTTEAKRADLGKATVMVERGQNPDGSPKMVATQPFLDGVDALLEAFEFRGSLKEVAGRDQAKAALEKWVADRWADGDEVVIPPAVMDRLARQTHWRDLTGRELDALRGAVESIEHQAKLRTIFEVGGQKVEMGKAIDDLAAAALENVKRSKVRFIENTAPAAEKAAKLGKRLAGTALRPEFLIETLDGYDRTGPWHRLFWNPLSDASYRFYDLTRQSRDAVVKVLEGLPEADLKRIKDTRFELNGETYTVENALVVLLNSGNPSNEMKTVRGMSDPRIRTLFGEQPWDGRNTRDEILSHLTKRDAEIAQSILDAASLHWEKAVELEKADSGLAPEGIKAKAFTFKGVGGEEITIKGGYYPLIANRSVTIGKRQFEADALAANGLPGLFSPNYDRAITPTGYLQSRVENAIYPIDLTLDALPRKLTTESKDIAFRLDAKRAYRMLMDERLVGALTQTIGKDGYDRLVAHLQDTVNDVMLPDVGAGVILQAFGKARNATSAAIFGANIGQALQNLADVAEVPRMVSPGEFGKAALRLAREEGLKEKILAESAEMRIRHDAHRDSVQAYVRDVFRKSKIAVAWEDFQDIAMMPFEKTNEAAVWPTYLALKERALAGKVEGVEPSEAEAIRYAQDQLRQHFGGKRTIDLPPIMRDKVLRWFTMFHSWANTQLNLFANGVGKARFQWTDGNRRAAVKYAAGMYAALWAKAILSDLFVGRGPKDDDKDGVTAGDWASWAAWKGVTVLPSTIPFVNSAVRAAEGGQGRDMSLTPWLSVGNAAVRAVTATNKAAAEALDGELSDDQASRLFWAWLEAGGMAVGAPVVQTKATGKAIEQWMTGGVEPKNPVEAALRLTYGNRKEGGLPDALFGGGP
jgi:GGDEF domain-containing protein